MSDEQTRARAADVRRRRRADRLAAITERPEIAAEPSTQPPTPDHPTGAAIEPQPPDPGAPQPPQAPAPQAAQRPDGVVLVDAAELGRLRELAAEPDRIAADLARREREQIVAQAVIDGRLFPRDRDRWLNALARDRDGTAELLASMPKQHDLLGPEIGHAGTGTEPRREDSWFPGR